MAKKYRLVPADRVRALSIDALRRAVKIVGGILPLSRETGISRQLIYRFLQKSTYGVSARYVLIIEEATDGLVTRDELRMDIYPKGLK